jgi:HSP20 family protein
MANLLPAQWRRTLARLREDVQDALSRWLSRRKESASQDVEEPRESGWSFPAWPAIEVDETADAVEVRAELPGLEKDDFRLEVVGDYLVLRGEKKREREEHREGFWYSECAYGAFTRWIPLPAAVVAERAQAKFRNGRLEVVLPKATPAKKIPVAVR